MVILPRASLKRGKDLKRSARQKYEEATPMFRLSSRGVAEGPMVILPRASLEKRKDLK